MNVSAIMRWRVARFKGKVMETFSDLTELCLFGVVTGFFLSFMMWVVGIGPRLFRLFVR